MKKKEDRNKLLRFNQPNLDTNDSISSKKSKAVKDSKVDDSKASKKTAQNLKASKKQNSKLFKSALED